MDKTYTYEELAKLGAAAHEHVNVAYFTDQPINARRPILRDGQVIMLRGTDATKQELVTWRDMCIGTHQVQKKLMVDVNHGKHKSAEIYVRVDTPQPGIMFSSTNMVFGGGKAGVSYEQAAEVWGIPRQLHLSSYAALFYLLYARAYERNDENAKFELDYFCSTLEPWFMGYLDMATGGEARYTLSKGSGYKGDGPPEVDKEARSSKYVSLANGVLSLIDKNGHGIDLNGGNGDRPYAWIEWKRIRDELGMDALNWCILAHLCVHGGGFAGPLWSNAAYLVRKRLLGEISPIFLIDQALSLQHNGGEIFNKLWDVSNLVHVLNNAFNGQTAKLPAFLDPEHAAIYRKVCVGTTPFDLRKQKGSLELRERKVASFEKSTVLGLKAGQ